MPTWAFDFAWGTQGNSDGQFQAPSSVCVKADGNVLVADDLRNDYQEFLPDGTFVRKSPGFGNGLLQDPFDIVVSPLNGDIFAIGNSGIRVLQYASTGAWIRTIGTTGTGNGQFQSLDRLAVDNSGRLYAGDGVREDIQRFTSAGAFDSVFMTGVSGGQVTISSYDNLVWCRTGGNTKAFDTSGNLVSDKGPDAYLPNSFGFGSNYDGYTADHFVLHFYVADRNTLAFTSTYGSGPGTGNGQFATNDPYDIWPSPNGLYLYVCDHNNHRMQRWVLVPDQLPTSGPHPAYGRGAC